MLRNLKLSSNICYITKFQKITYNFLKVLISKIPQNIITELEYGRSSLSKFEICTLIDSLVKENDVNAYNMVKDILKFKNANL